MTGKGTVLVVDDDGDTRETITDLLELEGYAVRIAVDGSAALDAGRQETFDAVLMDIRMPGMDGVEALRAFRALAPSTPVIMVTAYSLAERLQAARDAGAVATLQKPFRVDDLLELLEDVTSGRAGDGAAL